MDIEDIQSDKKFRNAIERGIALILFSAPWFAPCRLQEPILCKVASRFQGIATVGTVHVDESPEIAWNLEVRGVPTVILFKNGKEMKRFVGLQPENTLSDALGNSFSFLPTEAFLMFFSHCYFQTIILKFTKTLG